MGEAAKAIGASKTHIQELFENSPQERQSPLMALPQTDLPNHLKKAEILTIYSSSLGTNAFTHLSSNKESSRNG